MSKSHPIGGTFLIIYMDEWDQDFVNAEVPGFLRFERDGTGELQFGYVNGQMTVEFTERNGKPAVEWSWEGNDEMDPVSGRGWAVLQEDGSLNGKLFFHSGEPSGFVAEKQAIGKSKPQGRTIRAINAKTGEAIEVDVEKLKAGPIRQHDLSPDLLLRIRMIHKSVGKVLGKTLEEFEVNFMRDSRPEREVAVWERIVVGMAKVRMAMPKVARKVVLKTLLAYSMNALTVAEKADPTVKRIIGVAEGR